MTATAGTPRLGTVCTFYSYKGGVGRTFALANVATVISSWGYRVLCVDWDLEAPGLHLFFESIATSTFERGLVELIHDYAAGGEVDWRDYTVDATQTGADGTLTIMPAGRLDDGYLTRMQELDWLALYEQAGLGTHLEQLRDSWNAEYDFVLIDSRTGITDIGGICTVQLPDILVLLFTPNYQNVDGVVNVARRASAQRERLPFDRAQLPALPVVTRFEATVEVDLAHEWLGIFEKRLDDVFRVWTHKTVTTADMLNHMRIPYVAHWSFGERLPVIEEGTRDPLSIGYAFETVAALLANRLEATELLIANRQSYVDAARRGALVAQRQKPRFDFDVLVSYGSEDIEFGKELAAQLAARSFRTWPPEGGVSAAEASIEEVRAALDGSRNLVTVLSGGLTRWLEESYRQFLIGALSGDESRILVPVVRTDSTEIVAPFLGGTSSISAFDRPVEAVADDVAERLWREVAAAGDGAASTNLARLLADRGQSEEARKWLERAAADGHEPAMLDLGLLLAEQGETSAAEVWFQRGAEVGDAVAAFNLGVLLEAKGALDEAEGAYRLAAEAGNQDAAAGLATILARRGERTEAERWSRQRAGAVGAHLQTVAHALLAGKVVPFLGPGVNAVGRTRGGWSLDSGLLPLPSDLADYLRGRFRADEPAGDLSSVAQSISQRLGLQPLYAELHALLDADYRPNAVHAFLAGLPALCRRIGETASLPVVVTVNYDDALERAFAEAGEPYDVVVYLTEQRDRFLHRTADLETRVIADPTTYTGLPIDQRPIILKLLGSVDREGSGWESFVVTEDQFDDYLTRTHVSQLLPVQLAAILRETNVLFLAVPAEDRNFRTVLKRVPRPARGWASWAVQLETSLGARQFWQGRDVEVLQAPLEEYAGELRARIEAVPSSRGATETQEDRVSGAVEVREHVLPESPYQGLVPYSEADALFFFGRENECEVVLSNLRASRLTILYGPSGVGKTSLLHAGIAFRVGSGIVILDRWRDAPGPLAADAVAATARDGLVPGSSSFVSALRAWSRRFDGTLLVLLDQFEEYFLYHPDDDAAGGFAAELAEAVNDDGLEANFLISIREDALFKLDRLQAAIPNLLTNLLRLKHLDVSAGRAAIERPVERWNSLAVGERPMLVEPQLVEAVLHEIETGRLAIDASAEVVGAQASVEAPYLQLVMSRIWTHERDVRSNILRLDTLQRLGGAANIAGTQFDEAMAALPRKDREIAARLFRYLITPRGDKLALRPSDLAQWTKQRERDILPVLERLAGADLRILRPIWPQGEPGQEPAYELFHEVLVPAVSDWLARYHSR